MKKKLFIASLLLLIAIVIVSPTVMAASYSGSCLRYFYTTAQSYHEDEGSYWHFNGHNCLLSHTGQNCYSKNWYNTLDGGVDSDPDTIFSGGVSNFYTDYGLYNLAVQNATAYNVERMYSSGSFT